jgi:hypothetical protein
MIDGRDYRVHPLKLDTSQERLSTSIARWVAKGRARDKILTKCRDVSAEAVKTAEDQTKTMDLSRLLTAPRATHDIDNLPPSIVKTIILG